MTENRLTVFEPLRRLFLWFAGDGLLRFARNDILKLVKKDNKQTGKLGEDLATAYLEKKGYRIIERNFSTRFGEIDIVCWDGQILVFVEVKTKIGHDFGEPEEMVNKGKLSQVKRMGEMYIEMNKELNWMDSSPGRNDKKWDGGCRVDVVGIVLTDKLEVERLNHYDGVF